MHHLRVDSLQGKRLYSMERKNQKDKTVLLINNLLKFERQMIDF